MMYWKITGVDFQKRTRHILVSVGRVTALTCTADGTQNNDYWASMCYGLTTFVSLQMENSCDYLVVVASF
jgi:hypothetical protein